MFFKIRKINITSFFQSFIFDCDILIFIRISFRAALFTLFIKVSFFTSNPNRQKERLRRCITTAVWFSTSLVLALFIPNIGEAIAVVGGLAGCFILLFPGRLPRWCMFITVD